ncbi:MAG: hypothetical protein R3255_00585 [Candidatus Lokiarchaeia archaeon]|nr:hypothetical protein [Candidatus Lokiarchaeia archaeon]
MLRTFIFDETKSHWIEEEQHLLSQDICAILDEENVILYLWNGPKSKKKKFREAYKELKLLIANYPELSIQLIMSKKNFPMQIQDKLDSFLVSMKSGKKINLKFSRFITIRIYSISIIIAVLLPIISILNLSTSFFWSRFLGNYEVNSINYINWINFSKIITLIALIFFSINLVIGFIEYENQVIVFSLNSIIISIGIVIYLNQGVFLFLFQEGSTSTTYFILPKDIFIFLLLNLTALLIFEIPNIYKLLSFFKTYRKFIF